MSIVDGLAFLSQNETFQTMCGVLTTIVIGTAMFGKIACTPNGKPETHLWLPDKQTHFFKRKWELWNLYYGIVWMSAMGSIVVFGLYTSFGPWHYLLCMVGLAAPLLLQPFLFPCLTGESHIAVEERYSVKATLWIAIFTFIGNYWYTHYFYNVLNAQYTFRAHDVNGVPISMFFATHFYFSFYHCFANLFLRKILTTYEAGLARTVYFVLALLALSYITAFMESITISGFPCYNFDDVHMAYTLGSAFYGIYFIVSFPMFLRIDRNETFSLFRSATEALATGMAVLCLLDFVRLAVGHDSLTFSSYRPCKTNASLTCTPFEQELC